MTVRPTLSPWTKLSRSVAQAACAVLLLGAATQGAEVGADPIRIDNAAGRPVVLTVTKAQQVSLPVDVRDVLVADPAVADVLIKTPRLVYMIGSKLGDTNAIFLDAGGRQVLKLDIHVDRDLSGLRAAIAQLAPDADVTVRPLNQDLVISGDVPNAQVADNVRTVVRHFVEKDENIVNMMRITGAQQVVIRLKIAEVQRTVTKKLGFDLFLQAREFSFQSGALAALGLFPDRFGAASSVGSSLGRAGNASQGAQIFSNGMTTTTNTSLALAGATGSTATTSITFPNGPSASPIATSIEALEQQGLVKTLAEPNLTSLSGEPADFLAGGEFPVPTGKDAQGNIQIEFKPFGVSLSFTPVVLANGRISLRISTEVSEVSSDFQLILSGTTIPSLTVRRAKTTVEIPSGGSLVLGGLLRNDAKNTVNGLPALKDIPILGALFRSTAFLSNETELVVIATPYVVRATTPQAMTAPTDGFAPASDLDMYLLNGLYARYGAGSRPDSAGAGMKDGAWVPAKSAAASAPTRPFGYIMP